jgi:DNA-binding MarR family transcriptional regulator
MAAEDIDGVDPLTRPYYLIYQLSYLIGHDLDRVLRPMSLTRAQLGALSHLAREGDMSAADLARKSHVTAQSMGAALTQLADAELVVRRGRKENARIIDASITDKGRHLYRRVRERLRDTEARLLQDVYGALRADETANNGR